MKNELMTFEGMGVQIILNEQGEPLFELYTTGMALGYVRPNSTGKLYPRKDRIDKTVESAEISTCVHDGHRYLTEEQLYDFMLEAKTEKCKPFRKWVTNEVLPSIRKHGGYIVANEEESDAEIMARALLVAQKTIEKKNSKIAELTPKAEIYDRFIDKEATWGFRELRKELESTLGFTIKEKDLKEVMRNKGWIGASLKGLAYAIRNQYMVTKDIEDKFGDVHTQDRFTTKAREELLDYYLDMEN